MDNAICSFGRCRSVATFDSPRRWCTRHWLRWWSQGLPKRHLRQEVDFLRHETGRGHFTRSRRPSPGGRR
jgi:hypothetical protein